MMGIIPLFFSGHKMLTIIKTMNYSTSPQTFFDPSLRWLTLRINELLSLIIHSHMFNNIYLQDQSAYELLIN